MKKRSVTASGKGCRAKIAKSLSFYACLKVIRVGTAVEFKELLTQGLISNINMKNPRGKTLLMIQCINPCLRGVKLLIDHGADVNITDDQGNSALILACRNYKVYAKEECAEVIKLLVTKGADINVVSEFSSSIKGHPRGSALLEACITNRLDVVKLLLELGARTDEKSQTPLIQSCYLRNIDVIRLFICHVADVNIIDNGGHSGLSVACEHGYDDLVELLVDHGADVNMPSDVHYYKHALICACLSGHVSTVKLLLDRGANVNGIGYGIPLIVACQKGRINIVRLLLERGADVNVVPIDGFTPLIEATVFDHNRLGRDLIDLLLEYGADINAETDGGLLCALNYACVRHQRGNIIFLLERGADLYKEDGYTTSGLFVSDPEIAALVVKYGESNKRAYRTLQPLLK